MYACICVYILYIYICIYMQYIHKIYLQCTYIRRRQWHPTPILLPGKSHGRRGLVGCSSWGRYESDTTDRLHFHFSLPCIGEGDGNPLQCSCLENPRDEGAWWASVYGVAQSRTRLKQLSSKYRKNESFLKVAVAEHLERCPATAHRKADTTMLVVFIPK